MVLPMAFPVGKRLPTPSWPPSIHPGLVLRGRNPDIRARIGGWVGKKDPAPVVFERVLPINSWGFLQDPQPRKTVPQDPSSGLPLEKSWKIQDYRRGPADILIISASNGRNDF